VATGPGYVAAEAAHRGATVWGVDVAEAMVARARAEHPGVEFRRADAQALPFEDGAFDLVVSFETIEHVPDARRTLAEFRRVLADEGMLVISTPNKHKYLVENEFHTREYTREEFAALLEAVFPSVQLLLQHNWLASMVGDESLAAEDSGDASRKVDLYKVAGIAPGGELYSVGLCGTSPLEPPGPVAVSAGTDEAQELAVRLTSAETAAETWHREYVAARETAESWHREYDGAKQTAEKWHEEYLTAERLARELQDACDRASAELETVYGSASWRVTEPLRRVMARVRGDRG
jgi:SAM-dependent methyltransferase